jgi:ribonuclease HI
MEGKRLEVFLDGGSRGNPGPGALGVVIQDADGEVVKEYSEFLGETTNNIAEYTAVIRALELADDLGADEVKIFGDSQLVVRQLTGVYKIKAPHILQLIKVVKENEKRFKSVEYVHIPREENVEADRLVNEELDRVLGSAKQNEE